MNNREQVAQAISEALDGQLTAEDIVVKIEQPKTSDLGDLAFPTFVLAKTLHKAPN